MAVASIQAQPGSLLGKLSRARPGRPAWLSGLGRALREHMATVAAFGAFTVAGFEWSPIAGWAAVGVAILALDFQARG